MQTWGEGGDDTHMGGVMHVWCGGGWMMKNKYEKNRKEIDKSMSKESNHEYHHQQRPGQYPHHHTCTTIYRHTHWSIAWVNNAGIQYNRKLTAPDTISGSCPVKVKVKVKVNARQRDSDGLCCMCCTHLSTHVHTCIVLTRTHMHNTHVWYTLIHTQYTKQ